MNKTQVAARQPKPLYLPVLIMCAGALLAAFGALGAVNPDYINPNSKLYWYMFVAGAGLAGLGWCGLRDRWPFGLVLLSLFLGGGAQLWMTEPLWFPALRFRPDERYDLVMIGIIALQGCVALAVLLGTNAFSAIGRFFTAFGFFRIVVFLALSGAFAVSPLGYLSYGGISAYATHLIGGFVMMALNMASIAAMMRTRGPGTGESTFSPLVPALFACVASAILSLFAFERLPHVEDEVAFLFQAKTFAGGALSVPALPEATREGLEFYLLDIREGQWFSTTPPGWPALLTLGVLAGAPWLINPLLAFVCVLLAYAITARMTDQKTAKIVSLLMAISPWYLGTAASLMPHMIALTLTLFAWWALLKGRDHGARTLLLAALAGLAMGWLFSVRQLEALILGTLTGLWLLSLWQEPKGMPRVILYGLGCIVAGSLYLAFNYAMTGDALLDPLKRYLDASWGVGGNAYGFGPDIGPPGGWGALDLSAGHSIFEGFINFVNNMTALSIETFGWGVGSLALFWVYVLYAKPTRFEVAMATVSALVIAALFLYWFSGSFYIGPRYWFSTFFPLMVFSAKGLQILQDRLEKLSIPQETSGAVVIVLCAFSICVFTTWRGVEKYYQYNNFNTYARDMLASGALEDAIVFFDAETIDHGSALHENDPWQEPGTPLFIRDMGAEINTEVINALPGRPVIYLSREE